MKLADLADEAAALLADFETQLTALGVDVPDAVYRSPGVLPWDGPSLTIYLSVQGQENQGVTEIPPAGAFKITLYVQLIRTTAALEDNGDRFAIPNSDEIDVSGAESFSDAAALMIAAQTIHADYMQTNPGERFVIGNVEPLGPEGGLAAVRIGMELSLS